MNNKKDLLERISNLDSLSDNDKISLLRDLESNPDALDDITVGQLSKICSQVAKKYDIDLNSLGVSAQNKEEEDVADGVTYKIVIKSVVDPAAPPSWKTKAILDLKNFIGDLKLSADLMTAWGLMSIKKKIEDLIASSAAFDVPGDGFVKNDPQVKEKIDKLKNMGFVAELVKT